MQIPLTYYLFLKPKNYRNPEQNIRIHNFMSIFRRSVSIYGTQIDLEILDKSIFYKYEI